MLKIKISIKYDYYMWHRDWIASKMRNVNEKAAPDKIEQCQVWAGSGYTYCTVDMTKELEPADYKRIVM